PRGLRIFTAPMFSKVSAEIAGNNAVCPVSRCMTLTNSPLLIARASSCIAASRASTAPVYCSSLHYLFDETRRDEPAKDGLLNRLVFVFIRVPEMCANSRERFRIFSSRAGNATEERVRILLRPVPSNKKSALVALAVNSYRNAVVLTLKSAGRLVDS